MIHLDLPSPNGSCDHNPDSSPRIHRRLPALQAIEKRSLNGDTRPSSATPESRARWTGMEFWGRGDGVTLLTLCRVGALLFSVPLFPHTIHFRDGSSPPYSTTGTVYEVQSDQALDTLPGPFLRQTVEMIVTKSRGYQGMQSYIMEMWTPFSNESTSKTPAFVPLLPLWPDCRRYLLSTPLIIQITSSSLSLRI